MRRFLLGSLFAAAVLLLAGLIAAPYLARLGGAGVVVASVLLLPALVAGSITKDVAPFWVLSMATQYVMGVIAWAVIVGLRRFVALATKRRT
jgi:hypothetical protein